MPAGRVALRPTVYVDSGDDAPFGTLRRLVFCCNGWQQQVGSYPKLRIPSAWLAEQCRTAGLDVRHDAPDARGMRVLHAVKP